MNLYIHDSRQILNLEDGVQFILKVENRVGSIKIQLLYF